MTRDRLHGRVGWAGREFELIDTGGIEESGSAGVQAAVREQALRAAREADVVVMLADARDGRLPLDGEIARTLRRAGARALLLAVNKADTPRLAGELADFAALGVDPVLAVSAETGLGVPELLDAVLARLPESSAGEEPATETAARPLRVALVGQPNVGKSTLFNRLVGDERSIVSEVPGTTRDAVDVELERGGRRWVFLDTAGIRRPGRTERGPEVLSVVAARRAIERADVVVLVLDATRPPAHQDAVVAGLAEAAGRAMVVAATKSDLLEATPASRRALESTARERLKFLSWATLVVVSGRLGRGLSRLLSAIEQADRAAATRVPTARLNRLVASGLDGLALFAPGARDARILYAAQTGIRPPTFTFFCNRGVEPHFTTLRFLENRLRREFDLAGTPIAIRLESRGRRGPQAR